MNFERTAIEISKMINHLHTSNTPYVIEHSLNGDYSIGVDTFNCKIYDKDTSFYDALKQFYMEIELGYKDTENYPLDLDDETLKVLYEIADIKDMLVDEVVIEILKNYIDIAENYNTKSSDDI